MALRRKTGFLVPKKLFVISTEGTNTEPRYFSAFRPARDAPFCLKLLSGKCNQSHPEKVVERLVRFKQTYSINRDDELWAVIDHDGHPAALLDKVSGLCKRHRISLAVSNPCFELWLYLHLAESKPFANSKDCISALSARLGGYDKSTYDLSLAANVERAIKRAARIEVQDRDEWPRSCGTHVYKLMRLMTS